MRKKDRKPGLRKGLDTVGMRLLVITMAILMTFQFSTASLSGLAIADTDTSEAAVLETEQAAATEEVTAPEETPEVAAEPPEETGEEPVAEVEAEAPAETTEPAVENETTEPVQEAAAAEPVKLNEKGMAFAMTAPNKVNVKVNVEPGTFPEGTEMAVSAVPQGDVMDAVSDVLDANVTDIKAVDITFSANGKEVQPQKEVEVILTTASFDADADVSVVHVADNGEAEVIEDADVNDTNTKAAFGAEHFSVYAIVGTDDGINTETARRTYKFQLDDGTAYYFNNEANEKVDYQIVKNGDTLVAPNPNPTKEVTDENGGAWKFDGWYNGDTKVTFGTAESGISADETVTLVAKFNRVYYVHYYDTEYDIEGTKVQNIMNSQEVAEGAQATVDSIEAVPLSTNEKFAGWATTKDAEEVEYVAGDKLAAASKDVELYPVLEPAYWIHYYSNGDKASYTSPTQFFATENTVKPEDPTRVGYTFKEWCTDEEGTTPFTWGQKLTADQNLYASWTPSETQYTVITWQENADDDDYSFLKSEKKTGKSGEQTAATAESFTGFHIYGTDADETDDAYKLTQQTIAGDGSTIVNVYYNRNDYKVEFYTLRQTGGWMNPSYVAGDLIDELTITAKYNETITDLWPSRRTGLSRTYPVNWKVEPNGTTYQSNLAQMPVDGATFYLVEEGSRYVMTTNYYVQTTDGGDNFTLDHADVFNSDNNEWSTTVEDYYDIKGFTVNFRNSRDAGGHTNYATDTSVSTSDPVGSEYEHVGGYGSRNYKVDFYYLRNKYTVNFDLNGATGTAPAAAEVYYEKSLAGIAPAAYVVDETQYTDSQGKIYTFKGWYENNTGAGEAFDFAGTKMPANNLNLYAKWEEQKFKVNVDPDGGVLVGSESTWFNAKWGELIGEYGDVRRDYVESSDGTYYYYYDERPSEAHGRKSGYTTTASESYDGKKYIYEKDAYQLIGWFDKDTDSAYDFGTATTKDTNLIAKWKRVGKFTVTLFYNDAEGNPQTVEGLSYSDQATAVAPTSVPFTPEGKTLVGWTVKKTGAKLGLGESFTVDANTMSEKDEEGNEIIEIDPVFEDNSQLKVTEITFNANGGTGTVDPLEALDLNGNSSVDNNKVTLPSSGFTKEGYTLIGWSDQSGDNTVKYILGGDYAADGETNTLYAVWAETINVTVTGNTATETYDGTEKSNATTAAPKGYTVTAAGQSTTDASSLVTVTVADSVKAPATGTDSGEYPMGLSDETVTVAMKGETQTIKNAGEVVVIDGKYYILGTKTVTEGKLTISPVTDKVTVTITENSDEVTYDGKEHTIKGYKTMVSDNTKYDVTTAVKATETAAWTVTKTDAGTYDMGIVAADFQNLDTTNFPNVEFKVVDGQLKINPITDKVTVTITENSDEVTYDGKEHTIKGYKTMVSDNTLYDVTKAVKETETADWTVTKTDAGTYDMGIVAGDFENLDKNFSNVEFKVIDGQLKINPVTDKVTVTIVGNKDSKEYNGSAQKVEGYEVTNISNPLYKEADIAFSGTAVAEGTNAGKYPMGLEGKFSNNSKNFTNVEFAVTDGELEITKIKLVLESAGAEKEYDGTPLTRNAQSDVKIVEGKLAPTDEIKYDITGSQTYVGESDNLFTATITAKESAAGKVLNSIKNLFTAYADEETGNFPQDNYDITYKYGKLKVTEPKGSDKVITKTHEDKEYKVGDTVTFTIKVTNIYDEVQNITIEEQEGVKITGKAEFEDVEPGATVETTATYTVTKEDAEKGEFKNTATAKFENGKQHKGDDTVKNLVPEKEEPPKTGDTTIIAPYVVIGMSSLILLLMLLLRRKENAK